MTQVFAARRTGVPRARARGSRAASLVLAIGLAGPARAQPGSAKPGSAQPGSAKPGSAEPGSAKPGSAEPGSPPPTSAQPTTAQPGGTTTAPGEPGLAQLWREVLFAIDAAVGERARRPPVPVPVTWRERRIASVDLGAPLLAMTAVDMERDGRAELAALTTAAVVLLAPAGNAMREIGRLALPGDPAALRPRDPVGALAVDGRSARVELLARSSELAEGVALTWQDGALREERRLPGFPLCAGMQAELVPGRNYFQGDKVRWEERAPARFEPPIAFFSALCRTNLADPTGRPLTATAVVDSERVAHVTCRAEQGRECPEGPAQGDHAGVGVALEIADIDNDGVPELITTRGGAPGDRDRVSIYARQAGRVLRVFSKEFHAGVVGLTAGDLDGDGDLDVVVAVRFVGSRHVSFWTLN